MKRFLGWAFNILAGISTALLIYVIAGFASAALSDPIWLQVFADNPGMLLPAIVYSILPLAWLTVRAVRRRTGPPRGFDVAAVSRDGPSEAHGRAGPAV